MQGIILIIYTYNDVIPQANPLTTRGVFLWEVNRWLQETGC